MEMIKGTRITLNDYRRYANTEVLAPTASLDFIQQYANNRGICTNHLAKLYFP